MWKTMSDEETPTIRALESNFSLSLARAVWIQTLDYALLISVFLSSVVYSVEEQIDQIVLEFFVLSLPLFLPRSFSQQLFIFVLLALMNENADRILLPVLPVWVCVLFYWWHYYLFSFAAPSVCLSLSFSCHFPNIDRLSLSLSLFFLFFYMFVCSVILRGTMRNIHLSDTSSWC